MFSKNLRFYRLKSGMSMKQLASLVGVSAMTISYYESGERKPGMDDPSTCKGIGGKNYRLFKQ